MLLIQKNRTPAFFTLLSLPSTAMGFALSVQISALSWILSTRYGLAIDEVGLVWAAGPIAGIFGQVMVGLISDKVWFWGGRRRPFILIGGTLAAGMLLALPSIGIISQGMGLDGVVGIAILIALTLDLAINISFNPTRTLIADVTPAGPMRTKGYTWMQTISGSFGVGAYAIGAIWGNYVLIYAGAILVFVISFLPVWFIQEPRELDAGREEFKETNTKGNWISLLADIKPLWGMLVYAPVGMFKKWNGQSLSPGLVEVICLLLTLYGIGAALSKKGKGGEPNRSDLSGFQRLLAAHAFTWMGVQTMFIYLYAFLQDRMGNLGNADLGRVISLSFLLLNAVGALLPAIVLEPGSRRFGKVRVHSWAIASMALGYLGIALLARQPEILWLIMAFLGIGWAATVSLPFAIMSQQVRQAAMGKYMGLFNLSVVLPQLVSSLLIGAWIEEATNKDLIFLICAVCLGLSAMLWFFVEEPSEQV